MKSIHIQVFGEEFQNIEKASTLKMQKIIPLEEDLKVN